MIQSEEVKTDRNHTVPDIDTVTTTLWQPPLHHCEWFSGGGRDREIIPYMTLHCRHNQNDPEAVGETGKLYRTWHSIATTRMILRLWEKQGNYTLHGTTLSQAVGETEIIPYTTQHCHNHLTTWKALRQGLGDGVKGMGIILLYLTLHCDSLTTRVNLRRQGREGTHTLDGTTTDTASTPQIWSWGQTRTREIAPWLDDVNYTLSQTTLPAPGLRWSTTSAILCHYLEGCGVW